MKNLVIVSISLMFTSISFAQKLKKNEIPLKVKTAFENKYPTLKVKKWEKENMNYEASFEIKEKECSLLIDTTGKILETELEIEMNSLPENMKEYLSKNYPKQKINETAKITDSKGTITYEAEIKGKDLIFDVNGNFIK